MDLKKQAHQELDIDYKRRLIARRRIKIFLIIINAFLIGYSLIYLTISGYDTIRNYLIKGTEVDSYIRLCNKNAQGSKTIYNNYNKSNAPVYINDFSFYGENLLLSEYAIGENQLVLSDVSSLQLTNVCKKISQNFQFSTSLNQNIDLRTLDIGDYIIEAVKGSSTHNIKSSLELNETIYLLPRNGTRKKVTIKNNSVNPNVVISVEKVKYLPEEYVDIYIDQAVVPVSELVTKFKELNSDLVIEINNYSKETSNIKRLKNILPLKPRYIVSALDNEELVNNLEIIISSKIVNNFKSSIYQIVSGEDNILINESGGKGTNAISCSPNKSNSCDLIEFKNDNHFGIATYILVIKPEFLNKESFSNSITEFVEDFYLNIIG